MIWLLPGALAGLVLLAGPLAVHLLTRRQARRVPFPTIRFLREVRSTAVRLRRPNDLGLLLVRLAVVALAIFAAARPLVLVPARVARWNARVARVLVVDRSPSMQPADSTGRRAADALASAEEQAAFASMRIESTNLLDGIARAVALLETLPPARREIVVISDFQHGALSDAAVARVPADVGIRFKRAGALPEKQSWNAGDIDGWRGGRWLRQIGIDRTSTIANWRRLAQAPLPTGVTLAAAPTDASQARAVLAAAASLGLPSRDDRHVVFAFRGATRPDQFARAQILHTAWPARAARALAASSLLREAVVSTAVTGESAAPEPWTSIAFDSHGRSVVRAAEDEGTLLIDTSAPASSLFAAALVRAALLTRGEPVRDDDREVLAIPDDRLDRWTRAPGAVTAQTFHRVNETDARWFWAAALILLLGEGWLRRSRRPRAEEATHVEAA
jgi:hypothetical protein